MLEEDGCALAVGAGRRDHVSGRLRDQRPRRRRSATGSTAPRGPAISTASPPWWLKSVQPGPARHRPVRREGLPAARRDPRAWSAISTSPIEIVGVPDPARRRRPRALFAQRSISPRRSAAPPAPCPARSARRRRRSAAAPRSRRRWSAPAQARRSRLRSDRLCRAARRRDAGAARRARPPRPPARRREARPYPAHRQSPGGAAPIAGGRADVQLVRCVTLQVDALLSKRAPSHTAEVCSSSVR